MNYAESVKTDSQFLTQQTPLLWLFGSRLDSFRARLAKAPLAFVLFANRLDHERRMIFLMMIWRYGWKDRDKMKNEAMENFNAAIKDKRLIGIGDRTGSAPEFIEIQIADHGPVLKKPVEIKEAENRGTKEKTPKKGKKVEADYFDNSNAPYRISFECFIDIALALHVQRWSPKISRAFMEINRDGRYDDMFSNAYISLQNTYPDKLRTVWHSMFEGSPDEEVERHFITKEKRLSPDIVKILDDINRRHRRRRFAKL
ncbi:MAG: hypothetical protein HY877_08380 [Deltaproteobacteria bacterium]|nr:hypothetical protein [Deltaproteobacteria bacterium]